MEWEEAIERLRQGTIQVQSRNGDRPEPGLVCLIKEAFNSDREVLIGTGYYHRDLDHESGWNCCVFMPLLGISVISFNSINPVFQSGEKVKVYDFNRVKELEVTYVGKLFGEFVCYDDESNTLKFWPRIEKIFPTK